MNGRDRGVGAADIKNQGRRLPRSKRREDRCATQPKGRASPVLHDNLDGLLSRLWRVPRRLRHQKWILLQRFFLGLGLFHGHVSLTVLLLDVVIQAVLGWWCRSLGLQTLNQHVFPDLGRDIPVLDDAVLVHVVADLEVGAGDEALVAKDVALWVAGEVTIERGEDRLGDVFACKARACVAVPRIEDESRDFICSGR